MVIFKPFEKSTAGKIVTFKLKSDRGFPLTLVACDEYGMEFRDGAVCSITTGGELLIHSYLDGNSGLKLRSDNNKYISITYDEEVN